MLQRQIRALLSQFNDNIEIIVLDNCSSIPIETLFTKDELSLFNIERNSTNIGADANIARCFEKCTTKWLWTLGDDDIISDNAINTILNAIGQYDNAVFLNFWGRTHIETHNFTDLCNIFKNKTIFGASFSMSFCVYNINVLKQHLIHYYENITSMIGTLILVLKYAENNDSASCYFLSVPLIIGSNEEVSWNYEKFINRAILFTKCFERKNLRSYRKSLFLGYYENNYWLIQINRKSSKVSTKRRFELLSISIKTQGILNSLLYSKTAILKTLLMIITDNKYISGVLHFVKRSFRQS